MPLYRDEAIVLRTHKLGEADRIITMLTRTRGRVRAVAKGVRRTKSRFGSRLEPGMVVDVQCYEGRNLDTVTQVETIAPYGDAIARDYVAYTCATSMLETAMSAALFTSSSTSLRSASRSSLEARFSVIKNSAKVLIGSMAASASRSSSGR